MNILIVSTNKHPHGDAGAIREETFAKLFSQLGHRVRIAGLGPSTDFEMKEKEGLTYCSLRSQKTDRAARVLDRVRYFDRLKKYVLEAGQACDVLLFSSIPPSVIKKIKTYARSRGISLIYDCVEWYSPEQFKTGRLSRLYRNKNAVNTRLIDKSVSVIAISTYLESYFSNKGILTERIPVLLDVAASAREKKLSEEKIVYLYAGMPGRKDYLSDIVSGFAGLTDDELAHAELRLVGVTKEQLIRDCGAVPDEVDRLKDVLNCIGRVPHEQVLQNLQEADFTVLLRNAGLRYARAGFPTKVVESLSASTPVICNLSSDLGVYLSDGYDSFICADHSPAALTAVLRKTLTLSFAERTALCMNAEKTALERFDYANFADTVAKFLCAVKKEEL